MKQNFGHLYLFLNPYILVLSIHLQDKCVRKYSCLGKN